MREVKRLNFSLGQKTKSQKVELARIELWALSPSELEEEGGPCVPGLQNCRAPEPERFRKLENHQLQKEAPLPKNSTLS